MKQPQNSRIVFIQYPNQMKFELAPSGWKRDTFFWVLMSVIWIWVFVAMAQNDAPIIFLSLTGITALISPFVFLFFVIGKREISIDQQHITVSWSLFGQGRTRRRKLKGLKEVQKVLMYKKNRRRIYGIGLFFKDQRKLKFGSNLSEEDQEWLITIFNSLIRMDKKAG